MSNSTRTQVLYDIDAERDRQDDKWREQNHPDGTGPQTTPIAEIVRGPANKVVNTHYALGLSNQAKLATDKAAELGEVTWRDILLEEVFEALAESDPEKLRTELIQVAAVAAQWAEALDRRRNQRRAEDRLTARRCELAAAAWPWSEGDYKRLNPEAQQLIDEYLELKDQQLGGAQ